MAAKMIAFDQEARQAMQRGVAKLARALPLVETRYLAVLDDDTVLPSGGLARAVSSLVTGGLATGLPIYVNKANGWSRLVSGFVNGSALLTYPAAGMVGAARTINGMFYVAELAQLSRAGGFEAILGQSAAIRSLKQRAARMALVDAPLMIRGETGTGKELVAQACHAGSPRRDQPFFALNCAALPESLAESELFGYASGAFTGALRGGRPGLLELTDGGTLFLDEVGEMSPYLQAKLLRFLNDGSFRRVGGERDLKVNVRIISATHRALEDMVASGAFRQDLLFRLDVLQLNLPPLRERTEDILPLAQVFLERACAQIGRPRARLSRAAGEALLANPWHGNVRQLQNVVFRAVTLSDAAVIDVPALELAGADVSAASTASAQEEVTTLEEAVAGFERGLLQRLLPDHPSTRKLAERLGTSHSAIAARLRRYGLKAP